MEKKFEEIYAGFVGDNVSCNRSAFAILNLKYKKLCYAGCVSH